MSLKTQVQHREPRLRGVQKILSGNIESYGAEDSILDACCDTEQGAFDVWAVYQSEVDRDLLREFVEQARRLPRKKSDSIIWRDFGTVTFADDQDHHDEASVIRIGSRIGVPQAEPKPPEWIDDQDEIVTRLESEKVGSDEFEKAILIAEITDFADDKIERLLKALGQFVSNHRFATDDDTMTLLGCAIRKYALNMPPRQLEYYVDWLSLGETQAINNRIELELVKGVLWRISYESFPSNSSYPKTITALLEIAEGYLNPRLIFQESNVSIATLAVASLFVLLTISGDSDSICELMQKVKNLKRDWIAELVEDDIAEAIDAISEYDVSLSKKLSASFGKAKANLI